MIKRIAVRDQRHVVFWAKVPQQDVPHFVEAVRRWHDEVRRVCPAPARDVFCYLLLPVSS